MHHTRIVTRKSWHGRHLRACLCGVVGRGEGGGEEVRGQRRQDAIHVHLGGIHNSNRWCAHVHDGVGVGVGVGGGGGGGARVTVVDETAHSFSTAACSFWREA
jgi:hypothetical protein